MSQLRTMTLDQCCAIVSGATPKTSVKEYWDGDILWTTPKDLSNLDSHYLNDTPRKITSLGLASCGASMLPSGSVLFSSRAPIGHVAINTVPMATNQGFKSFIPNPALLDAKFLFHWLRANREYLENLGNGATFKEVSKATVARIEISLPDVFEQRRIAAILDQADALRAKRRGALAQLDSLTQSIFIEMFGDPVSNDRAWPWATVSDFVAGFESGKSIVADDEDASDSPYRVLKISAVTSLEYKPEHSKAMPSAYTPPASHIVRKGDLLFSRANTTELIGATAYVDETPDNLLLPDKLWRFVWFEKPRAAPLYVRHLFQQAKLRREIGDRASGSSGSMKNISQPKVLSIQVGNPPLVLQHTFSTRVQVIESVKSRHRAALSELDELFASLQHRAFRGEL